MFGSDKYKKVKVKMVVSNEERNRIFSLKMNYAKNSDLNIQLSNGVNSNKNSRGQQNRKSNTGRPSKSKYIKSREQT